MSSSVSSLVTEEAVSRLCRLSMRREIRVTEMLRVQKRFSKSNGPRCGMTYECVITEKFPVNADAAC